MSDRLADIRLFVRVARSESFSATAREFGLTQPAVSRAIARLERELGVVLLLRTTRAVSLTEAGIEYLSKVEPAVLALDEAAHSAHGPDELRGVLRVAVTSSVAVREILPVLPTFTSRHPNLRFAFVIADERRRLIEEGIDVSLRLGPLGDSSMVARHVGKWPFGIFASPDYLSAVGVPKNPRDLDDLSAIYHAESPTHRWSFRKGRTLIRLEMQPRHVVSSQEGCVAAAKAGLGFICSATLAVRQEVEQGTLVPLLTDWDIGFLEMNLVFPAGRAATRAARAFADFVTAHFRDSQDR